NRVRQFVRGLSLISAIALPFGARTANAACPAPAGSNKIVVENCLAGNPESEWQITGVGDTRLQGYATDISYAPGQTAQFKITTSGIVTAYHIDIYRLGWYNGSGGRLVATVPNASI